MFSRDRYMKALIMMAIVGLLTACGGSSGGSSGEQPKGSNLSDGSSSGDNTVSVPAGVQGQYTLTYNGAAKDGLVDGTTYTVIISSDNSLTVGSTVMKKPKEEDLFSTGNTAITWHNGNFAYVLSTLANGSFNEINVYDTTLTLPTAFIGQLSTKTDGNDNSNSDTSGEGSPSGNWVKRHEEFDKVLRGTAWNGERYVAVGERGLIITSTDGIEWTQLPPEATNAGQYDNFYAVTWTGSEFVAVTWGDIFTSADGLNWKEGGYVGVLEGVASDGQGTTVLVGRSNEILILDDFTSKVTIPFLRKGNLYDVTWNGSKFVAVGDSATILTSSDGYTWKKAASSSSFSWNFPLYDVAWVNDRFLAVGSNGFLITSSDGDTWTQQTLEVTVTVQGDDGNETQQIVRPTAYLEGVGGNGDEYLLTAKNGRIYSSQDTIIWKEDYRSNAAFLDVLWDGSQFIVVGGRGLILTK